MPAYIRRQENQNGGTIVQVEFRNSQGKRVNLKHIGTAYNEVELDYLYAKAKEVKLAGQMSFDFISSECEAIQRKAYSELLWDTLKGVYASLGFDCLDDITAEDKCSKKCLVTKNVHYLNQLGSARLDCIFLYKAHLIISRLIVPYSAANNSGYLSKKKIRWCLVWNKQRSLYYSQGICLEPIEQTLFFA